MIFIFLSDSISAQTDIEKQNIDKHILNLKRENFRVTTKFNRSDLFHNSMGTHNRNSYSKFFRINVSNHNFPVHNPLH